MSHNPFAVSTHKPFVEFHVQSIIIIIIYNKIKNKRDTINTYYTISSQIHNDSYIIQTAIDYNYRSH